MATKVFFNCAPLTPNRLAPLSVGAIKPEGWLREQLTIQANGLSGRLFDIWPDVGESSGWLGGDGDDWERAPYYLDGLLPLAYQLCDQRLIDICNRFIEWTLDSQDERGFFGPKSNDDWWPRMVMLKVMQQHVTATSDKRALMFMDRYFRYQLKALDTKPLKGWAVARGGENIQSALWLYNITKDSYLLKLCQKLKEQTLDWTNHFHVFPHIRPMSKQRPWADLKAGMDQEQDLLGKDQPYYHREYHLSHGVNIAMCLKTPGVTNLLKSGFKELTAFRVGYQKLMKHHGVATGMFTCDEHVNGSNPSQGTELCAVVELMYSIEVLLSCGDEFANGLPDLLEKLAFNALPASFDKDMLNHQYDQQANQIKVSREARSWYNNGDDSNLFGLEPNFGCCTANMHQGWPKFVNSLWYATNDGGLYAVSYAPCSVNFVTGGRRVDLRVDTGYPFEQTVKIEVDVSRPVEFPLHLRIPDWAKEAMVHLPDGEIMQLRAGESACVRRRWTGGERVTLDLPMAPIVTRWFHQSAAVELGPLVMCYRPDETWTKLDEHNYAVGTKDTWNYALAEGEAMKVVKADGPARAFKHGDGVKVHAKAYIAKDWGMSGASCDAPPIAPEVEPNSECTIELTPYGSSSLRITQFPTVKPQ